ncbi:stress enhanced protein 1, chloroplastic isoform X2 [Nymphaea colorata]|uniref:stress enhanced protein 1, chloroplastic isoform X2 n=1 Tax=Nymphaea colorata TaxID=210225 RepID=UPI00129E49C7|nr:stress enhanced protein 1, chloroplastic isoform X2 [Nymphaea colorata]
MAYAQASQPICSLISKGFTDGGSAYLRPSGTLLHLSSRKISGMSTTFARGSPLLWKTCQHTTARKNCALSIRCEQGTKGSNSLDIWLGRLAMVGFLSAVSVEVVTGKGLLENFGLTTPLPTVALAVTALVGALTAVFIFQSAARN